MAGKNKKRRTRRFWSNDERRLICAQARMPGFSDAQVARIYAMNTNPIHTWLRYPKFAPEAEITEHAETRCAMLTEPSGGETRKIPESKGYATVAALS